MATLTDSQKSAARYHMGCPDAERAASVYGAWRMFIGTSFEVDQGILLLNDSSTPRLLAMLEHMDRIEAAMMELVGSAEFTRVGDLERNRQAKAELVAEYNDWQERIGSLLGMSEQMGAYRRRRGGGGVNGTWTG